MGKSPAPTSIVTYYWCAVGFLLFSSLPSFSVGFPLRANRVLTWDLADRLIYFFSPVEFPCYLENFKILLRGQNLFPQSSEEHRTWFLGCGEIVPGRTISTLYLIRPQRISCFLRFAFPSSRHMKLHGSKFANSPYWRKTIRLLTNRHHYILYYSYSLHPCVVSV